MHPFSEINSEKDEGDEKVLNKIPLVNYRHCAKIISKVGAAVVNTGEIINYDSHVPGGTLNTGGRAGQVLLKDLRLAHPAGSLPIGQEAAHEVRGS